MSAAGWQESSAHGGHSWNQTGGGSIVSMCFHYYVAGEEGWRDQPSS